jgi:pimeloyl-ACP methyl ester carboxylesterase
MKKIRFIIQSLLPWMIFIIFNDNSLFVFKISTIAAFLVSLLLCIRHYRYRFILDRIAVVFFGLYSIVLLSNISHVWMFKGDLLASSVLAFSFWTSLVLKDPLTKRYGTLDLSPADCNAPSFSLLHQKITLVWALIFTLNAIMGFWNSLVFTPYHWLLEVLPPTLVLIGLAWTLWYPSWKTEKNLQAAVSLLQLKGISGLQITYLNTGSVSYRTLGQGTPLFLLPGRYMNSYMWEPQFLKTLAAHHTLFLIDYPEIGETHLQKGLFNLENITFLFSDFIMRHANHHKVSLLGFGMGSWIAQKIALNLKTNLGFLILIGSDVGSARTKPASAHILTQMQNNTTVDSTELLQFILKNSPENQDYLMRIKNLYEEGIKIAPISNIVIQLENILTEQWYSGEGTYYALSKITTPTLILTGTQDKFTHPDNSAILSQGIYNSTLKEFDRATHGLLYEYPVDVANAILAWEKIS